MRAVLQRVSSARVRVGGRIHSEIGPGLLVLVGVQDGDDTADAALLAKKTLELRIFEDGEGRMNRSVGEIDGSLLAVSQFTLLADCRKGRRPSFSRAAPPDQARKLYDEFVKELARSGLTTRSGVFRETMQIELSNEGPVTLILDTRMTS